VKKKYTVDKSTGKIIYIIYAMGKIPKAVKEIKKYCLAVIESN